MDDLRRTLVRHDRSATLERLICLLNLTSRSNFDDEQQKRLLLLLITSERARTRALELFENRNEIKAFFRGQIVTLIDILLSSETSSTTIDAGHIENEVFLELLLVSSNIWGQRNYKTVREAKGETSINAISFRKGIEATIQKEHYYFDFAEARIIYGKLFPTLVDGFHTVFQQAMRLSTNEYLACFVFFLLTFETNPENANGRFETSYVDTLVSTFLPLREFLERHALPIDQLQPDVDYLSQVMKYPLIRGDRYYYISDYQSFLNSMLMGPIFLLPWTGNNWISLLGKVIESFVGSILTRAYQHENRNQEDLQLCLPYTKGRQVYEVDAVISSQDSLVLIEIKNAVMPKASVEIQSPEKFLEELINRYVQNEKEKPKGVGQLHRMVEDYLNGAFCGNQATKVIFPVLVVSDQMIAKALTNKFLADRFRELMLTSINNGLATRGAHGVSIAPLAVISVRELEMLEKSIGEHGFEVILRAYAESNTNGNLSLTDFVAERNFEFCHNPILVDIGVEGIEELGAMVLPGRDLKRYD